MKQVSFSKYEKFQKGLDACCQFLIFPEDHFEDNEGYTTLNQFQYRGYNQLPKNKYFSIKNTIKSVKPTLNEKVNLSFEPTTVRERTQLR